MGNINLKKQSIENRIIEYLKLGWLDFNDELRKEIETEIRKNIKIILDDEFDNLVLY